MNNVKENKDLKNILSNLEAIKVLVEIQINHVINLLTKEESVNEINSIKPNNLKFYKNKTKNVISLKKENSDNCIFLKDFIALCPQDNIDIPSINNLLLNNSIEEITKEQYDAFKELDRIKNIKKDNIIRKYNESILISETDEANEIEELSNIIKETTKNKSLEKTMTKNKSLEKTMTEKEFGFSIDEDKLVETLAAENKKISKEVMERQMPVKNIEKKINKSKKTIQEKILTKNDKTNKVVKTSLVSNIRKLKELQSLKKTNKEKISK